MCLEKNLVLVGKEWVFFQIQNSFFFILNFSDVSYSEAQYMHFYNKYEIIFSFILFHSFQRLSV